LAFVLLAAVALGQELPRGDAKTQGFSPEKLERIPALLKEAVEKKQIAGGVALVARRGKVIHASMAGPQDIETKAPMAEGTIFRIASMSKPITSVAVMQLVEDGKLKLTDPLSKFVPEFKDMKVAVPSQDGKSSESVKAEREITIHDLLTHSSGITYRIMSKPHVGKLYEEAGVCDGLVESPVSLADNVRKIAELPLVCQPGSAWEYGLNTDVRDMSLKWSRVSRSRTSCANAPFISITPLPASDPGQKKFNSRLVAPTLCNIKSRRWLQMQLATGLELLSGRRRIPLATPIVEMTPIAGFLRDFAPGVDFVLGRSTME
jgi:Beta-lactamase